MASILSIIKKDIKTIKHIFKVTRENKDIAHDPLYFKPFGINVFFGEQGSGKTIALVHYFHQLKEQYPLAIVVSNIVLTDMKQLRFNTKSELRAKLDSEHFDASKHYIFYHTKEQYELVNRHIQNGTYGVILITDEYQNYFSNQDSKNVPTWVLEQNAQNRKQCRVQLATSQDYDQLAKPIRRRSTYAIQCRSSGFPFTFGDVITQVWVYNAKKLKFDNDGLRVAGKPLRSGFFFHTPALRVSYDTRQVVFTGDVAPDVYTSPPQVLEQAKKRPPTAKNKLLRRLVRR